MKETLDRISETLPRREVKVKAHAFTLASVIMLFFLPFALFGLSMGIKEGNVGALVFGLSTLALHSYLIRSAIQYFRTEKAQPAVWVETQAYVSSETTLSSDPVIAASLASGASAPTHPSSGQLDRSLPASRPVITPKGVRYTETFDGFLLECSTLSAEAFILVPFTLVWVALSVGGIRDTQFAKDEFDLRTLLYGSFFIIGSILLIAKTLMSVFGQVRFELKNGILHYFSGIHPLGRRKYFDWHSLSSVREEVESWKRGERPNHAIYLEGTQRHVVGEPLSAPHRFFVVNMLNEQLKRSKV